MSQKERAHQSFSEWVETQASDDEVVQDWDPASSGVRARCDGHVPEFDPAQKDDGCGLVWQEDQDRLHYDESTLPFLERTETQDQLRTWLELQSEEMGHRQERIDVGRAWAAASANMKKKSRWSMVRGPTTVTMATLHDLSITPASPWKWYPAENPDVDWTYSGGDPTPFP